MSDDCLEDATRSPKVARGEKLLQNCPLTATFAARAASTLRPKWTFDERVADPGMTRETTEDDPPPAPAPGEVLSALIDQHGPSVYRMARSIVRDPALAEDVAQETFIKAWQHADSYRGTAPIRHWLLRIAHNVAVSTLRTLREDATDPATLPERPSSPAAGSVASTVEARLRVDDALARGFHGGAGLTACRKRRMVL
jgi:sigma-70-like protein